MRPATAVFCPYRGTKVSKVDEASIALWLHYRREPEQFASLPKAWQRSIAENYAGALKRRRLRQRPAALPISVLATLAAMTVPKANAMPASDTSTLTGEILPTGIDIPVAATATDALVAGDAALALSNLWQVDQRAAFRRSESLRLGEASTGSTFWADEDSDGLKGDGSGQRTYRQSAANTSAGAEWRKDADGRRSALGLFYTHAQSRADLQNGRADLGGDSAGAYGTWSAANGVFADAAARIGRLSDTYRSPDALGMTLGRYHAQAASIAARAGRHIDVGHGGYIEPRVQAAYGVVGRSSYTASNRVHIEVGRNRTFQSRVGVLGGHTFAFADGLVGDVYASVAVVHTVGHRPDVTATLDGGALPVTLPARHDTAGEATVGAHVGLAGAWTAFAEAGRVSKSDQVAGGWRASVGFRWSF